MRCVVGEYPFALLQLNSTLETHQLSLRSSFEDQLSSLRQFVLEQVESGLTEAMVIEVVRIKLMEQLSAAKKEWIAEVCPALICLSLLFLPINVHTYTLHVHCIVPYVRYCTYMYMSIRATFVGGNTEVRGGWKQSCVRKCYMLSCILIITFHREEYGSCA